MKTFTSIELQFIEHMQLFHLGKENCVTSKQLGRFGTGRDIRVLVNSLRTKHIPICSGPTGYYYAKTAEELDSTLKYLYSHARKVLDAYHGLVIPHNFMVEQEKLNGGRN